MTCPSLHIFFRELTLSAEEPIKRVSYKHGSNPTLWHITQQSVSANFMLISFYSEYSLKQNSYVIVQPHQAKPATFIRNSAQFLGKIF
jgi:hypothetical protein